MVITSCDANILLIQFLSFSRLNYLIVLSSLALQNWTHQHVLFSLAGWGFSCWYFLLVWMFLPSELVEAEHTTSPQTSRLCFPNLLFLSTIQCDKICSSAVEIFTKLSAESEEEQQEHSSTVLQEPTFAFRDWPVHMIFIVYNKLST